ncbi:MAG: hypothetical protein V4857_17190 [Pseudomonadota bacterium]
MFIRSFSAIAAIAAACIAGQVGAANAPPPGTAAIKAVSLIELSDPALFLIRDLTGKSLLSFEADRKHEAEMGRNFEQAVKERNFKFAGVMVDALMREFKKKNVALVYLKDQTPKLAADGKSDDYTGMKIGTDSFLMVWFGPIGFLNIAKPKMAYKPLLVVNAKLVDVKTQRVLFLKTYNAGYSAAINGVENVELDMRYTFPDVDNAMKRIGFAFEGYAAAEKLIAERIVRDIDLK